MTTITIKPIPDIR